MTLDDIKWGIVNAKKVKVKQEVSASIFSVCIYWNQPWWASVYHRHFSPEPTASLR